MRMVMCKNKIWLEKIGEFLQSSNSSNSSNLNLRQISLYTVREKTINIMMKTKHAT